jgi:hypothetical protein
MQDQHKLFECILYSAIILYMHIIKHIQYIKLFLVLKLNEYLEKIVLDFYLLIFLN